MQDFRKTGSLREFYDRHKPIIDVLARDDEMFRAVKEIAEIKDMKGGEKDGQKTP